MKGSSLIVCAFNQLLRTSPWIIRESFAVPIDFDCLFSVCIWTKPVSLWHSAIEESVCLPAQEFPLDRFVTSDSYRRCLVWPFGVIIVRRPFGVRPPSLTLAAFRVIYRLPPSNPPLPKTFRFIVLVQIEPQNWTPKLDPKKASKMKYLDSEAIKGLEKYKVSDEFRKRFDSQWIDLNQSSYSSCFVT